MPVTRGAAPGPRQRVLAAFAGLVGAMASAVGLAEQGLRITDKNGVRRWHRAGLSDANQLASRESLRWAGVVLDYDADRQTHYADDVLDRRRVRPGTLDGWRRGLVATEPPFRRNGCPSSSRAAYQRRA